MTAYERMRNEHVDKKLLTGEYGEALTIKRELLKLFDLPVCEDEIKVTEKIIKAKANHDRKGLHASEILEDNSKYCTRRMVLSLNYKRGIEKEPYGMKPKYEEGNMIHEKWQRLFIRGWLCGLDDVENTQIDREYNLLYTPDAIINVPGIEGELIVEIKSMSDKQYNIDDTKHRKGTRQVHFYMNRKKIKHGIVLCENKNDQEIRILYYKRNDDYIREYIDRLDEVKYYNELFINERKLIARPEKMNVNNYVCEGCPMRDACYNIGNGRILLDE